MTAVMLRTEQTALPGEPVNAAGSTPDSLILGTSVKPPSQRSRCKCPTGCPLKGLSARGVRRPDEQRTKLEVSVCRNGDMDGATASSSLMLEGPFGMEVFFFFFS